MTDGWWTGSWFGQSACWAPSWCRPQYSGRLPWWTGVDTHTRTHTHTERLAMSNIISQGVDWSININNLINHNQGIWTLSIRICNQSQSSKQCGQLSKAKGNLSWTWSHRNLGSMTDWTALYLRFDLIASNIWLHECPFDSMNVHLISWKLWHETKCAAT